MSTWADAMDQPLWGYGPDGALMPPGNLSEAPERPEDADVPVAAVVASETTGDPSALSLRARAAVAHLALFGFNPHQLRGPDGRWIKMGDVAGPRWDVAALERANEGWTSTHDPVQQLLAEQAGFTGPPRLGTAADVDAVVRDGGAEVFRAYRSADHLDQFKRGAYFAAPGAIGAGIYATSNPNDGFLRSDDYAMVSRMALAPDAKTTSLRELRRFEDDPAIPDVIKADEGRLATALGYDAYYRDRDGARHWVVLNRTALTMEDAPPGATAAIVAAFNPHQLRGPDGRWVKMPTHLRKERRRERDRERRAAKKAERDGGQAASPAAAAAEPADNRAAERPGTSAQRRYREARDRFNREMVDFGQFQVNDNDFDGVDDPALMLDLKSLKAALVRGDDLEADEAANRLHHRMQQDYGFAGGQDDGLPAVPDEAAFDPEVKAQRALREALDRYNAEIHADALEWVAEANEPDVDWSLWGLSDAQGAVFADALFERTARLGAAIQDGVPAAADRAAAQLRRLFVETGVRPDHDFNSLPTIEEFREQGRIMAPPPARKANPLLTGGSGHSERLAQLERAVATGVWGEEELGQGAMGETKKVLLNDGTTIISKRARGTWPYGGVDWTARQQTDAEELSALVGSALGLRSPAVQRVDDTTINMEFVPDAVPAFQRFYDHTAVDAVRVPGEILGSDDGLRMGLLDALIGNPDRHGFNWMIDDDNRLYPIDNGLAFVNLKGTNESDAARSPFAAEYFVHPTGRFKDNILTRRDIQWVREQMEALAPEFLRVGQPAWYTQLQNRLRQLEIRARGGNQHQLPEPQQEVRPF